MRHNSAIPSISSNLHVMLLPQNVTNGHLSLITKRCFATSNLNFKENEKVGKTKISPSELVGKHKERAKILRNGENM